MAERKLEEIKEAQVENKGGKPDVPPVKGFAGLSRGFRMAAALALANLESLFGKRNELLVQEEFPSVVEKIDEDPKDPESHTARADEQPIDYYLVPPDVLSRELSIFPGYAGKQNMKILPHPPYGQDFLIDSGMNDVCRGIADDQDADGVPDVIDGGGENYPVDAGVDFDRDGGTDVPPDITYPDLEVDIKVINFDQDSDGVPNVKDSGGDPNPDPVDAGVDSDRDGGTEIFYPDREVHIMVEYPDQDRDGCDNEGNDVCPDDFDPKCR